MLLYYGVTLIGTSLLFAFFYSLAVLGNQNDANKFDLTALTQKKDDSYAPLREDQNCPLGQCCSYKSPFDDCRCPSGYALVYDQFKNLFCRQLCFSPVFNVDNLPAPCDAGGVPICYGDVALLKPNCTLFSSDMLGQVDLCVSRNQDSATTGDFVAINGVGLCVFGMTTISRFTNAAGVPYCGTSITQPGVNAACATVMSGPISATVSQSTLSQNQLATAVPCLGCTAGPCAEPTFTQSVFPTLTRF